MELKVQKRLASQVLKCSPKRVTFDVERLEEIKESITKVDIRKLVGEGAITRKPVKGISRVRARARQKQKNKGRKTGQGRRKGKKTARLPKKGVWMNKIRLQRRILKTLREKQKLTSQSYQSLYRKAKGGYFRSKRHLKMYITEKGLVKK